MITTNGCQHVGLIWSNNSSRSKEYRWSVSKRQAFGEKQNLSGDEIKELMKQNPKVSEQETLRDMWRFRTLVLANNHRVDISLTTTSQQPRPEFPYQAEHAAELLDRNSPVSTSAVQLVAKIEKITKQPLEKVAG